MLMFAAFVIPLAAFLFGCVGAHPGIRAPKSS